MVVELIEKVNRFESVVFDFDGVLVDSDEVRLSAFREAVKGLPNDVIADLIEFHLANGGLSRYVKFDYIVAKYNIDEALIPRWLEVYSEYCRRNLRNRRLLIPETFELITSLLQTNKDVFIVSASDQLELRGLIQYYGIPIIKERVLGSPESKQSNIERILKKYSLDRSKMILIGDSLNDFQASNDCNIQFLGFGNDEIISKSNV